MVKNKNKKIVTISLAAITAVSSLSVVFVANTSATNYSPYCISQTCRDAADKEAEAQKKANELTEAANTLQGEVDLLNAEISALEAQIDANQAIANDLSNKIKENEKKLEEDQTALAGLLVEMHFKNNPEAIMILAGSDSISDLAEKQSRQDAIKNQVTMSVQAIKELKAELAKQKEAIDTIIATQETNRASIASKRNEQNGLIAKYKYNSDAYAADAEAARKIKQQEIADEIARYNSGGTSGDGFNTYPIQGRCPTDPSVWITDEAYGGVICQCTSYAGWKVYEYWGIDITQKPGKFGYGVWGNAKYWGDSALINGYTVNNTPAPNTVAFSVTGGYGHVMWVESVNSNGTINLTEYNNYGSSKSGLPEDFGARYNVPWWNYDGYGHSYQFIHFD